jgi:hypothetical protein
MDKIIQLFVLDELGDDAVDLSVMNHVAQTNRRISSLMISTIVVDEETSTASTTSIQNYYEEVIPGYSDEGFRSHFRMSRSAVEVIVDCICIIACACLV